MAGIAPVVVAQVILVVLMVALMVVAAVTLAISKTVLMMIAVQSLGLAMDLLTVKIRPMAVILPAMIMMAATAKVVAVAAVKTVMTVYMIGLPTAQNAVIQRGMNMALIALR